MTLRQRPETAGGVTFVTLETGRFGECTGMAACGRTSATSLAQTSRLLAIDASLERADGVQHLIIQYMQNCSPPLAGLQPKSPDFH